MVKMTIEYTGQLRCKAIHQASGSVIETDAPIDIGGKGQAFSPTDLLAVSLASCVATTIALYAQKKKWDISGMRLEVEKRMVDQPTRRIGHLQVNIWIPHVFSEEEKLTIERVAHSCPVHKSLSADVEVTLSFHW
jgi:uncharacterized OsmC-like protein